MGAHTTFWLLSLLIDAALAVAPLRASPRGAILLTFAAPSPGFWSRKKSAPIGRLGAQELDWESTIISLWNLTNVERSRYRLSNLGFSPDLTDVAQRYAEDMVCNNYFSHFGLLDGSNVEDRVQLWTNYRCASVSENLFWQAPDNIPAQVVKGWMGSPAYRENLLGKEFSEIGIGYASTSGDEKQREHYYVQIFARPIRTPLAQGHHTQDLDWKSTIESLLSFSNAERRRFRLNDLSCNADLTEAAQRHAEDMARNGYFAHTGLNGSSTADRVRLWTDYRYRSVGENIFWLSPDNIPEKVVKGWMDSNEHRKNLLNREFEEIGLGYASATAEDKKLRAHYYVQVFARPLDTPNIQGESATCDFMYNLTNRARTNAKLTSLQWSDKLAVAAQTHAEDMAQIGSGSSCDYVLRVLMEKCGFRTVVGIFAFQEPFSDPLAQVEDWLQNPESSSYIFDDRFTETGLGYATDGERHYFVQLFGTPWKRAHC